MAWFICFVIVGLTIYFVVKDNVVIENKKADSDNYYQIRKAEQEITSNIMSGKTCDTCQKRDSSDCPWEYEPHNRPPTCRRYED